jgi:hypothetical protein
MANNLGPIDSASCLILRIEQARESDDLSDLVASVNEILGKLLEDSSSDTFGQAVLLQFSLLDALLKQKKLSADDYSAQIKAKAGAILRKSLPATEEMSDLSQFLKGRIGSLS